MTWKASFVIGADWVLHICIYTYTFYVLVLRRIEYSILHVVSKDTERWACEGRQRRVSRDTFVLECVIAVLQRLFRFVCPVVPSYMVI